LDGRRPCRGGRRAHPRDASRRAVSGRGRAPVRDPARHAATGDRRRSGRDHAGEPAGGVSLMDAPWIECGFDLSGQQVHVAVGRLGSDERLRMASEIAWYADALTVNGALRATGWPDLLDRILTNDVAITCNEDLWASSRLVQDEIVCRAFQAFVTA